MTRVLVSGGWGYGNVGDDAILLATIDLLKDFVPGADIIVSSYDPDTSAAAIRDPNVLVVPSIHRHLVGSMCYETFQVQGRYPRGSRLFRKAKQLGLLADALTFRLATADAAARAEHLFSKADLFIQAGGGYFNSQWIDSLVAHALELQLAHRIGTTALVLGQSVGPFYGASGRLAVAALRHATLISVRDHESLKELNDHDIRCSVVPDSAIATVPDAYNQERAITMVVNRDSLALQEALIPALISVAQKNGCRIKIAVSRLWTPDIEAASGILDSVRSQYDKAELLIPSSVTQLQAELGTSLAVVSQNLHGLILAFRAGVPGVSLSTGRKFVAFMHQSGQGARQIGRMHLSSAGLASMLQDAVDSQQPTRQKAKDLADEVRSQLSKLLQSALGS